MVAGGEELSAGTRLSFPTAADDPGPLPEGHGAGHLQCVLRRQLSYTGSEAKSRAGFWSLICAVYLGPRLIINILHG